VSYGLSIGSNAERQLLALPAQMRVRVSNAIDALRAEPRPPGARKLEGEFRDGWRIRIGRLRVLTKWTIPAGKSASSESVRAILSIDADRAHRTPAGVCAIKAPFLPEGSCSRGLTALDLPLRRCTESTQPANGLVLRPAANLEQSILESSRFPY
jgi:mRNA interferase RelE/StbE